MANIGNNSVYIGSPDWYIGDPESYAAKVDYLDPQAAQYGLNSSVRFMTSGAYSPDPLGDRLFYEWYIVSRPGKSVSRLKEEDEAARLELDAIGIYTIGMYVAGANGGSSDEVVSVIVAQPASVAYNGGLEYDVSWVWRTLSDFWSTLGRKDRMRIEAVWQALQAIVASDMMDVYNTKDSISINTIQANIFRKWTSLDLTLDLSDALVMFGPTLEAGTDMGDGRVRSAVRQSAQRYDAKLLKTNELFVPGVLPQHFDVGRPARITNVKSGNIADVKIIGIGDASSETPTFTIPSQNVASSELPQDYDLRLMTPTLVSKVIIDVGGQFVLSQNMSGTHIEFGAVGHPSYAPSIPIQLTYPNAEALGISSGDVVEVMLLDEVSRATLTIFLDVTAVYGDLVALSTQETLRTYLSAVYDEDVTDILYRSITDSGWQARHRGVWVRKDALFQIGVGGIYKKHISIKQAKVYRRRRVPLDDSLRSLFRLTSNITRYIESDEGLLTAAENVVHEAPIELYENVDFYIKRPQDIGYRLRTTSLNEFEALGYDFSLARVAEGDQLVVMTGLGTGTYTIVSVSQRSVQVSPPARVLFDEAQFYVKTETAYLELHSTTLYGGLTDTLWAEYAVYDNGDRIESVFGEAIGLRRDLWESLNNRSTYRDAVASIIKARVTASTVESIDNITSLALGVAVSPYKSVIRDIDYEYRVDPNGNPTEYHVVLEEISDDGTKTGRLSTHEVSATSSLRLDSTSGMSINPVTGAKYVEGDLVEQYASIAEGVRVIDLYTTDMTFALDDVIDRHRFAILIDFDSVSGLAANPEKLSLARALILETKPSYTTFFIRMLKYLVDYVPVEDEVFIKVRSHVYDNPYHHRGPANIFDDTIPGSSTRDLPPILPITTWFPRDGLVSDVDLTQGTLTLNSSIGGFVNPQRTMAGRRFDTTGIYPWIEPGDYVKIRTSTELRLEIVEVLSDTVLALRIEPYEDRMQLLGVAADPLPFFVYRELEDFTSRAAIEIPVEGDRVLIDTLGTASTNLGIGDVLTIETESGIHTGRLRILDSEIDPITDVHYVRTYPAARGLPPLEEGTIRIFRELIKDRVLSGTIVTAERAFLDIGEHAFTVGIDVGDIIDVKDTLQAKIVGICQNRIFTETALPANLRVDGVSFNSYTPSSNDGADDLDEHELAVGSSVQVILRGVPVQITSKGVVRSDGNILVPGDILLLPRDIDLGEGSGVVRVCAPVRNNVYLTNLFGLPFAVSEEAAGEFTCSLIRQDKLHSDYFFTDTSITEVTWGNVRTRP